MQKKRVRPPSLYILSITLGCILLDQGTKLAASTLLTEKEPQTFFTFITFNYIENPHGFLGIYTTSNGLIRIFSLYILPSLLIILLSRILLYQKNISHYHLTLGSIIIGAALSNLLDRIFHAGAVVDFIQFHLGFWQSGVGNIADILLMIAAFLLGFSLFAKTAH